MKIKELIDELKLETVVKGNLEKRVSGIYICDLLSNVMSKAKKGDIWITIQGHENVVAVALLTEIAAVIVAEDYSITENAIKKAEEKNVNLLHSPLTAYEIISRLCNSNKEF